MAAAQLTEQQWFSFLDYPRMLNQVKRRYKAGRTLEGKRKLRLFACGSCRLLAWDLKVPNSFRLMVETAERFADGELGMSSISIKADGNPFPKPTYGPSWYAAYAMQQTNHTTASQAARWTASHLVSTQPKDKQREMKKRLAEVVREVFGNPFRAVEIDPAWLAWHEGAITKIAQTIYDERAWSDMPVLADALEEAGCHDTAMIEHLRGPGPHVRGCWVIDALLRKG